jgi:hypothetical protein
MYICTGWNVLPSAVPAHPVLHAGSAHLQAGRGLQRCGGHNQARTLPPRHFSRYRTHMPAGKLKE